MNTDYFSSKSISRSPDGEINFIRFNVENNFLNNPRVTAFIDNNFIFNKKILLKYFNCWNIRVLSRVKYSKDFKENIYSEYGDIQSNSNCVVFKNKKENDLIKIIGNEALKTLKYHVVHEAEESLYFNDKRIGDPHPKIYQELDNFLVKITNKIDDLVDKYK